MDVALVTLVSVVAACLTLFSGFGLGTLLTPVFALYLPVPTAVAATAVVHLANNVFKLGLIGRWASRDIVLRFGVPAMIAAFGGAYALVALAKLPSITHYDVGAWRAEITPVKAIVGVLILAFAIFELRGEHGAENSLAPRWLPLGGVLSGFFGGLSGHQGALRSAFLIQCGLSKEALLGSNAVIAILVDMARLAVYGGTAWAEHSRELAFGPAAKLAAASIAAAFAGSFVGAKLVKKVTITGIRRFVAAMLLAFGAALTAGLV